MSADERRRTVVSLPLLAAGAAWGGSAFAQLAADTGGDSQGAVRLALLVGNRVYPDPFDLPPAYKNVRDLAGVLERRGFNVTSVLDQNPAQLHSAIQAFAKVAADSPPNATILFYYTGHGMQVDAENLMLGSGVPPDSREDTLLNSSLHLRRDVIDQLPRRAGGLTIAVVDGCRTSLRAALKATDGFNQVEATSRLPDRLFDRRRQARDRPGRRDSQHLLHRIARQAAHLGGRRDFVLRLFRLVKFDVQQTMENFPVKEIRQFTQIPFIAENTQVRFQLALRSATQATTPQFNAAEEAAAWRELEENLWPADIVRLSEAYLQRYPSSKLVGGAQVAHEGAADAVRALRSNEVRLFRSAFQPKTTEPRWLSEWRKAARGDKDAAARIARAYLRGQGEIGVDPNRYEGWMQYAAALGNGIASYELAVYYRRQAQPVPAAQYETRARDLGYTPPTSLDNQRK